MRLRSTLTGFLVALMFLSACAVDPTQVAAEQQTSLVAESQVALPQDVDIDAFNDGDAETTVEAPDPSPTDIADTADPNLAADAEEPEEAVGPSAALVGFAQWVAPADDPIQLIQRIESPYAIADLADTLAAQPPNDARCFSQPIVPAAAAYTSDRETHNPGVDYVLAIHHDASEAAEFASDYATVAAACNPTSGGTITASDFTDTDLDLSGFRAWDAIDDTGARTHTILTTHHGVLSVAISLERREITDDREYRWVNHKLERVIDSLNLAPIEPPPTATWLPDGQFEDYMLEQLGLWSHRFSDEEKQCLLTNVDDYSSGGTEYLSSIIVEKLAGWCAPVPTYVEPYVDSPGPAKVMLTDVEQRRCFLVAKAEYGARGTFDDFLDRARGQTPSDAWAPERLALDARLLDECGIDEELAIRAGLPPRGPLDDSPEREAYCAAYNTPLSRTPAPFDATSEEENLLYLRDIATALRARVAPPEIADAHTRSLAWYDYQVELLESTGRSQVEFYSDPAYVAKQNELKPDEAKYQTGEYARVNC